MLNFGAGLLSGNIDAIVSAKARKPSKIPGDRNHGIYSKTVYTRRTKRILQLDRECQSQWKSSKW